MIDKNSDPSSPRLIITAQEAAQIIGMAHGTAENRLSKGTFPIKVHKEGRPWMCVVADVEAYIALRSSEAVKIAPEEPAVEPSHKRGPGRPRKVVKGGVS